MATATILWHPKEDAPFELFGEEPSEEGPLMDDDRMKFDEYLLDLIERTDWDECVPAITLDGVMYGPIAVLADSPF